MSQIPPLEFGRFTVSDERARMTIQMMKRTGVFAAAWLLTWNWVAPVLGVRMVDPIEFNNAFFTPVAPTLHIGAGKAVESSAIANGMLPSIHSETELALGLGLWIMGAFAALCGLMTIVTALWCVVGRFAGPSTVPDTGGEA